MTVTKNSYLGMVTNTDALLQQLQYLKYRVAVLATQVASQGMDITIQPGFTFKSEFADDMKVIGQSIDDAVFTIEKYYGGQDE